MKKKFLTAAAVCALSAVCIFGATACGKDDDGGSDVPEVGPSVQVADEAAWKEACNKTLTADYTCFMKDSYSHDVSYSYKATYYNFGNEHVAVTEQVIDSVKYQSYEYYITEDSVKYCAIKYPENQEWEVYCNGDVNNFRPTDLIIADQFSELTYENGAYVFTSDGWTMKYKVNADGYICYINEIGPAEFPSYREITFYNFGNTTYNVPAAAKQAIADFKAANN